MIDPESALNAARQERHDRHERMLRAVNRLTKWRAVFAGWQLGTRTKGDPEGDAVRDHRELTMVLRAEVTALTALMIEKGVFSTAEFEDQVAMECAHLEREYERRFPGFMATDGGITVTSKAQETAKGWRP